MVYTISFLLSYLPVVVLLRSVQSEYTQSGLKDESFFLICDSRYHYNVADARLIQHIEKGYEDGLFISCVASSQNLWALIMDAGTGFTSQVHELSPYFLHKVHLIFLLIWNNNTPSTLFCSQSYGTHRVQNCKLVNLFFIFIFIFGNLWRNG